MGTERKWLHKVFSYEYANNKIWHITESATTDLCQMCTNFIQREQWHELLSTVLHVWLLWLCHWTAKEFNCMWERSSEEMVTFEATMYIKIYRRQLLEKCWNVWDSHTTFQDQCAVAVKKQEQSLEIYHEGCQGCVRSFCDEGAWYSVQWLDSVDLYIMLNLLFVYCAQSVHVIFIP